MSDEAKTLEPTLTKRDLRILAALPAHDFEKGEWKCPRSIYSLAEELNTLDLEDLLRTLRGFEHLGLALARDNGRWDRPKLWARSRGGDVAVGEL